MPVARSSEGWPFRSPHLLQGVAPHHEGSAGADHRIEVLAGGLDPAVEALLIRQQPALQAQVAHHRIGIHVALGGLHEPHGRITEQAGRAAQEGPQRHDIGIEHRHQIALAVAQSVVEVARLGMGVVLPGEIAAAEALAELRQLLPAGIVQQPDRQVRVVHRQTAPQAALHQLGRFTAAGHQHIDRRRWHRDGARRGHGPLGQQGEPQLQEEAGQQHQFGRQRQQAQCGGQGVARLRLPLTRQCRYLAPSNVSSTTAQGKRVIDPDQLLSKSRWLRRARVRSLRPCLPVEPMKKPGFQKSRAWVEQGLFLCCVDRSDVGVDLDDQRG